MQEKIDEINSVSGGEFSGPDSHRADLADKGFENLIDPEEVKPIKLKSSLSTENLQRREKLVNIKEPGDHSVSEERFQRESLVDPDSMKKVKIKMATKNSAADRHSSLQGRCIKSSHSTPKSQRRY